MPASSRLRALTTLGFALTLGLATAAPTEAQQRPLTFLGMQELRSAGSWTPSPQLLKTLETLETETPPRAATDRDDPGEGELEGAVSRERRHLD